MTTFYTYPETIPTTIVRNFYGNIPFAIANGHFRITHMGNAIGMVRRDLSEAFFGGNKLTGEFKTLRERFASEGIHNRRALHSVATELGVISDNVYSGEIKALLSDMGLVIDQAHPTDFRRIRNAFQTATERATDIYSAMDDVWKLYGWFNEIANGKSLEDAAKIVRDTYPTYSNIPRYAQELRRFPVLGTFFSFPAEVVRVGKNTAKLAFQEAKQGNPRRLVGLMGAAAATFGTAKAFQYANGITDEEQHALREFVAPWEVNGQLVITDIDDETVTFYNTSYTDPWSVISDPVRAVLNAEQRGEPGEGMRDAAFEFFEPFLGEGLFTEKVIDWARNKKKSSGQPVYNEEDSTRDKFVKSALHIGEAIAPPLTPGIGSQYMRLEKEQKKEVDEYGRRNLIGQELTNLSTGLRKRTVNKQQSLKYRLWDIRKRIADANQIFSRETVRETATVDDFRSVRKKSESSRRKIFEDFQRTLHAARVLGISERDIALTLDDTGMPKEVRDRWLKGVYTPYIPGATIKKRIYQRFGKELLLEVIREK